MSWYKRRPRVKEQPKATHHNNSPRSQTLLKETRELHRSKSVNEDTLTNPSEQKL